MKQFGLIGYPLSHSFSPGYFKNKFLNENISAEYNAYPLKKIEDLPQLIQSSELSGLNVTIPYKEQVLPYIDTLDLTAAEIGAVNTIKFTNGKSKGYNTDVYGFEMSLLGLIDNPSSITNALILGTGGASKAVQYVLMRLGISFTLVSRNSKSALSYSDLKINIFSKSNLIINTSPQGMYPDILSKPDIPFRWLNENYFLYDLVYNPEKTLFLSEGISRGCKVKNGHDMLILQAEKSWEIWNQS